MYLLFYYIIKMTILKFVTKVTNVYVKNITNIKKICYFII